MSVLETFWILNYWYKRKAYSGTLTRREIVRANASLGELRRDKEKLSSPISRELRRDKASQGELRENGQSNVEVIRVNIYHALVTHI